MPIININSLPNINLNNMPVINEIKSEKYNEMGSPISDYSSLSDLSFNSQISDTDSMYDGLSTDYEILESVLEYAMDVRIDITREQIAGVCTSSDELRNSVIIGPDIEDNALETRDGTIITDFAILEAEDTKMMRYIEVIALVLLICIDVLIYDLDPALTAISVSVTVLIVVLFGFAKLLAWCERPRSVRSTEFSE